MAASLLRLLGGNVRLLLQHGAAGAADAASITSILTFFSIGVLSNFKKLWQEGIGRLAAVYLVSLFGFVIWVGLLISWLFFSGVKPPLAS